MAMNNQRTLAEHWVNSLMSVRPVFSDDVCAGMNAVDLTIIFDATSIIEDENFT